MLIVCANACLTLSFIKSNIIITMRIVAVLAIWRRRFVNAFLAHQIRISACFTCTDKSFLAYRIRISACFTCAYKSYLTHVISPGAG